MVQKGVRFDMTLTSYSETSEALRSRARGLTEKPLDNQRKNTRGFMFAHQILKIP